jgi:hypothetical protein
VGGGRRILIRMTPGLEGWVRPLLATQGCGLEGVFSFPSGGARPIAGPRRSVVRSPRYSAVTNSSWVLPLFIRNVIV